MAVKDSKVDYMMMLTAHI